MSAVGSVVDIVEAFFEELEAQAVDFRSFGDETKALLEAFVKTGQVNKVPSEDGYRAEIKIGCEKYRTKIEENLDGFAQRMFDRYDDVSFGEARAYYTLVAAELKRLQEHDEPVSVRSDVVRKLVDPDPETIRGDMLLQFLENTEDLTLGCIQPMPPVEAGGPVQGIKR